MSKLLPQEHCIADATDPLNLNWHYSANETLSTMENLQHEHKHYETLQSKCQAGVITATIRMAEIYLAAKKDLETRGESSSNEAVGKIFGKTEGTVRNYLKIFNHQDKFVTPVTNNLSVKAMVDIIDGRAILQDDGTVNRVKPKAKKLSQKDQMIFDLQREVEMKQMVIDELTSRLNTIIDSHTQPQEDSDEI